MSVPLTRFALVGLTGVLCFLLSCGGPPPDPVATDHAVYAAVLRHYFATLERGEHGSGCESEGAAPVRIVATTQPLPASTPKRDAGWAEVLPAPARPLLARLRRMNGEPALKLDSARFALGRPVTLVPEAVAAPTLWPAEQNPALYDSALWWFSRVAYTHDDEWALVFAAEVCPNITPAMVPEAEPGAYETVFLVPLQRREGTWTVHDPLYLDLDLPRLEAKQ